MKGAAYYWWKQLQRDRIICGKEEIISWPRMRTLLISRFTPSNCSTRVHSESNGSKHNGTADLRISGASEVVYEGDGHSKEMSEVKPVKCVMEFPIISSNETAKDEDYIEEATDTTVVTHLRFKHACSSTSVQLSADDLQPKQRTILAGSGLLNLESDQALMEESQMESFVNCNTPTIKNSIALLIKSTAPIGHEKVTERCWMTPEAIPPSLINHRPLMEGFVGPCVVQRCKIVKVKVVRYVYNETQFWVSFPWFGAYSRMVVFLFDPGGAPCIAIMRNFGNYLSYSFGLLLHCSFLKINMETEILSFTSSSMVKANFVCCGVIGATHIEIPLLETSVNWCDQNHTSCMFLCGNADHELKILEIINGWPGGMTITEQLSPRPLKLSTNDGMICAGYFVSRRCGTFVIGPTMVVSRLLCCYLSSVLLIAEAFSFIFDGSGKWKDGPIKGIRQGTKLYFLKDVWSSREQQVGETSRFKQLIFESSFLVEEYTFGKGSLCYGWKMSDEYRSLLLPIHITYLDIYESSIECFSREFAYKPTLEPLLKDTQLESMLVKGVARSGYNTGCKVAVVLEFLLGENTSRPTCWNRGECVIFNHNGTSDTTFLFDPGGSKILLIRVFFGNDHVDKVTLFPAVLDLHPYHICVAFLLRAHAYEGLGLAYIFKDYDNMIPHHVIVFGWESSWELNEFVNYVLIVDLWSSTMSILLDGKVCSDLFELLRLEMWGLVCVIAYFQGAARVFPRAAWAENEHCEWVGEYKSKLKYSSTPRFIVCFGITKMNNEDELFTQWLAYVQEVEPGIFVGCYDEFSCWSLLERRATHHRIRVHNELGCKSLVVIRTKVHGRHNCTSLSTIWPPKLMLHHHYFAFLCLQMYSITGMSGRKFYVTRGRVISWVGWHDEHNYDTEGWFISVEQNAVTIFSKMLFHNMVYGLNPPMGEQWAWEFQCAGFSNNNGHFKKAMRLFFKLVNGLDPPPSVYSVELPTSW